MPIEALERVGGKRARGAVGLRALGDGARYHAACARRCSSSSSRSTSCARAYARRVSRRPNRGLPLVSTVWVTRLASSSAVERVGCRRPRDDPFDLVQAHGAGEHAEGSERAAALVVEQAVAPVDRGLERLLAFGLVRRPTAEERQALGEPPGRLLGSQDADPRGGELDRER